MRKLWKGLLAGTIAGGIAYLLTTRGRGTKPRGYLAQGMAGVRRISAKTAKRIRRTTRDWKGFIRTGRKLYKRGNTLMKTARKIWRR